MTSYTLRHSDWQWLIQPESNGKKYLLRCRQPSDWVNCRSFNTPEEAADSVAKGTTGQKDWDERKREDHFPTLAAWLIDPTGGPLAPIVPVVSDILRATILPPPTGIGGTS